MTAEEKNKKEKKGLKDFQKIALLNTSFTVFFSLLPFWIVLIITLSSGKWTDWSKFYGNGEFYLYSTSLISSAYLIYHHNRIKSSDLNSTFSIISLVLIFIGACLFFPVTMEDHSINPFIKWSSVFSILIAIPLFFHSQIISNRRSPDVGETRRDEQEAIMNGLN